MFTLDSLLQIILMLIIGIAVTVFMLKKSGMSSLPMLLLGAAIIFFSESILEDVLIWKLDEYLTAVGSGLVLAGLIKRF